MFNAVTDNGGNPTYNTFIRGTTSGTINYSVRADGTEYLAGELGIGTTYSSATTWTPNAQLEVSGTISATSLLINGVSISGNGATGDRIVSGSINAIADVSTGAVRVSGTLALNNTGNEPLRCGPLVHVPRQPRNAAAGNVQTLDVAPRHPLDIVAHFSSPHMTAARRLRRE
ncbi:MULTISPECIES: hypothetical protein [unclassified Bradyrhizobium]|uniref:hypothetical protein n=1 Tax=unclassified Bradyrhizobium TaxID=2631580 RepID=UPI001FF8F309|nr:MULTISPECIES: hypothetical protein [unclassified Bradyrhizobium]MCK1615016.1 hypothetical protein [Bradyrhizobium sp. 163]MCK1761732.1 hypothetical protein [Bradyrhizobium sp. 136]